MRWLTALLLFTGLLLTGSDGAFFPWPNLAGVGLFVVFAVLMSRQEARRQ